VGTKKNKESFIPNASSLSLPDWKICVICDTSTSA
jgi:hypothetical protein